MGTRIRGTATLHIDYVLGEDIDELEAEEAFNEALDQLLNSGWPQEGSYAEYDQNHEFNVEGDENELW